MYAVNIYERVPPDARRRVVLEQPLINESSTLLPAIFFSIYPPPFYDPAIHKGNWGPCILPNTFTPSSVKHDTKTRTLETRSMIPSIKRTAAAAAAAAYTWYAAAER